jgi:hypothetical protein
LATYTWANVKFEIDDSSGSSHDISQYVTTCNGIHFQAPTVDVTPAGAGVAAAAWVKQLFGGIFNGQDITLTGVFDDTATTGPDALFKDLGCIATSAGTRTFKVTYGGTKSTAIETIITGYDRDPVKGQPTMYTATLSTTGAPTEA